MVGGVVGAGVAVGLIACSAPFSPGSGAGGADAATAEGSQGDGSGAVDSHTGDGAQSGGDAPDAPDAQDAAAPSDAAMETGPVGDASDAGLCQGAFSAPTLVLAHNAQYFVDSITFTPDELQAIVTLNPAGSSTEQRNVYEMHRAAPGDVLTIDTSQPLNLTEVGPTPGAFDVALSADGLTLYFSHRQDSDAGALGVDIYETQRGTAAAPFGTVSELGPAINDPTTTQFHAHPAGSNLYFTVTPVVAGAQGQRDLYVAPLQGGVRTPLAELNGATTQEANPVPSQDQLEIFFSSDRAAHGQNDLVYSARRASAALTFSPPALVPLAVGDASTNVTPQYLSPDSCRLYILVGQEDVYVAQRAP